MDPRFRDSGLADVLSEEEMWFHTEKLLQPPLDTTIRLNTLQCKNREGALSDLSGLLPGFEPAFSETLPDVIVIPALGPYEVEPEALKVLVNIDCGKAVLRGACVFAPGVIALSDGGRAVPLGARVSVWIDLEGRCTRGLRQEYTGGAMFIGNGRLRMDRDGLFGKGPARGMAVDGLERVWQLPELHGLDSRFFPQNLPSILAVQALDPQPGSTVLDMCASPGGKTGHIAALMGNRGALLALDKNPGKVNRLLAMMARLGATCVRAECRNSAKLLQEEGGSDTTTITTTPTFDYILLDPPCSAFGQKPDIVPSGGAKVDFKEYASFQKCLFANAHGLLRVGGILLYSTCSIGLDENERLVAEMLARYPDLVLEPILDVSCGSPGLDRGTGLAPELAARVRRFWPTTTIGFFMAKFRKFPL